MWAARPREGSTGAAAPRAARAHRAGAPAPGRWAGAGASGREYFKFDVPDRPRPARSRAGPVSQNRRPGPAAASDPGP
jgi:hypothetical protein